MAALAALMIALAACGGEGPADEGAAAPGPTAGAEDGPAETPPEPPMASIDLPALQTLRVGMHTGLSGSTPLPSTADEIDAFARGLGIESGCAGDDGFFSDETGVEDKLCGPERIRIGAGAAWLRFHVRRFRDPAGRPMVGEDGVARLRMIELVPPLAGGLRTVEGSATREWAVEMAVEAERVYGEPTRARSEDVGISLWALDDRFVALVTPDTGDRAAALLHLGPSDPDLPLYGIR